MVRARRRREMMSTFSFFHRFNNFNDLRKLIKGLEEIFGTKNAKSVIVKIEGRVT